MARMNRGLAAAALGLLAALSASCALVLGLEDPKDKLDGGAGGATGSSATTESATGTGSATSTSSATGSGGNGGMTSSATGSGGMGNGGMTSSATGSGGNGSATGSTSTASTSATSGSSSSGMCGTTACPNGVSDCPATGNECVGATCDATMCCGTTNLDQTHTLSTGQTAGDCQKVVCDGNGGTKSVDDLNDKPTSTTLCLTNPSCSGVPAVPGFTPAAKNSNCTGDNKPPAKVCGDPAVPALAGKCVECNSASQCAAPKCNGTTYTTGASCNTTGSCVAGSPTNCANTGKVCDPTAGCVTCNVDNDCPATGNECAPNVCTNHACVANNLGASHVFSQQNPHDCQKIVCNGAGGVTSINDPTDLPVSNTVCQINPACTGSPLAPSFTSQPAGTDCTADNQLPKHLCGSGVFAGTCVQCNGDADCVAINDAGILTCSASHVCQ
jgi:hypothetical protein